MMPSTVRPSMSKIGAAAHVQECQPSQKCSVAYTCTGCRVVSAVPIPFVPADTSSHFEPSTMPDRAAARSHTAGSPVMCSTHPVCSVKIIRPGTSSRKRPTSLMIGTEVSSSSWLACARCRNSSSLRRRATVVAISTPNAMHRCHSLRSNCWYGSRRSLVSTSPALKRSHRFLTPFTSLSKPIYGFWCGIVVRLSRQMTHLQAPRLARVRSAQSRDQYKTSRERHRRRSDDLATPSAKVSQGARADGYVQTCAYLLDHPNVERI